MNDFEFEANCKLCSGHGCPDCDEKGTENVVVDTLECLAANIHRLPVHEYVDAIAWAYAAYTAEGEDIAWIDRQPVIVSLKQQISKLIAKNKRAA